MRSELRSNKDGSSYYSFIYFDSKTGKQTRLTKDEIRKKFGKDVETQAEATQFQKLMEMEFATEKIRIERKLAWLNQFVDFTQRVNWYEEAQKKAAPNSYKNSVFYLKNYVLTYFLKMKKINNPTLWPDHFEAFKVWLENDAKTIRGNRPLAYQSKNHCVKALNTFMTTLEKQKIIVNAVKCETFPEHLMKTRDIDDVLSNDEMEKIYNMLLMQNNVEVAHFFRFLFFTGLRFNEGLATTFNCIFKGEIPDATFDKKLASYGIGYSGYIILEGQLASHDAEGKLIDHSQKVTLCPFKGKKLIAEKFNRTIPIIDKQLWKLLADKCKSIQETKGAKKGADCLIFPNINDATATKRLQEAFRACKLKYRSWHCLRHSRATYLVGETNDSGLASKWLGHSSPRTLQKYDHSYQKLVRTAKAKTQVW